MQCSKAWHSRHISRVPSPLHSFSGSLFSKPRCTFLKEHEIFDYSAADFKQYRETLRKL